MDSSVINPSFVWQAVAYDKWYIEMGYLGKAYVFLEDDDLFYIAYENCVPTNAKNNRLAGGYVILEAAQQAALIWARTQINEDLEKLESLMQVNLGLDQLPDKKLNRLLRKLKAKFLK